jgi:hypothetical protein
MAFVVVKANGNWPTVTRKAREIQPTAAFVIDGFTFLAGL